MYIYIDVYIYICSLLEGTNEDKPEISCPMFVLTFDYGGPVAAFSNIGFLSNFKVKSPPKPRLIPSPPILDTTQKVKYVYPAW